jgi:hypothetical protein
MEEALLPTIGEAIAGHPNARAAFPNYNQHVTIRMKFTSVDQTCVSPALLHDR